MRIAFHSNEFDGRAAGSVPYHYAKALKALGHDVCFISTLDAPNNSASRLAGVGPVFHYKGVAGVTNSDLIKSQIEQFVSREKIDFIHMLKFGTDDGITPKNCVSLIHCVFDMSQPHGDYYFAVSEYLANKFNSSAFLPHIVDPLPQKADLRLEYGIPKNAIVFGRHGGSDQFDLPFVKEAIERVLKGRKDVYFLFLNTDEFCRHDHVIHIPWTGDEQRIYDFIHACDCMLHARAMGETFGLSVMEFSACSKPVLTWDGVGSKWTYDTAHISHLGDKAILYSDKNVATMLSMINNGAIDHHRSLGSCNCADKFRSDLVAREYQDKFLKPAKIDAGSNRFTTAFDARGTDKGDSKHGYGDAYEFIVKYLPSAPRSILEIGVYDGASIMAWADLFPEATIVGVDNNTKFKSPYERVKVVAGDQRDLGFLGTLSRYGPFDIIIDDGSHVARDQQDAFKALWPMLADGGVYVIEDLEVAYVHGYQSDWHASTLDWLKGLATFSAIQTNGKEPWILFAGELAAIFKPRGMR